MFHFPLLVILGNFMKRILKRVAKNRWLLIYEVPENTSKYALSTRSEYVHECLSLLSTFTQTLRCAI